MFKRALCFCLILALFAAAMPACAFAGESCEALKSLREIRYLDKLCAVNSNAPDWHEGMSLQSANSLQMETALSYLLDEVILPTLDYLEQSVTAQFSLNAVGAEADELLQARNECRALRDAVQAELEIISYERSFLPSGAEHALSGEDLTENQAESAAKRVLLGVDRLESSMRAASKDYPEWTDAAYRLSRLIFPDDPTLPARSVKPTPLQTHIVSVRAGYMDLLLEEASRITEEERSFARGTANGQNEVEIYAVPRDKILFDVRDESGNPVADAQVLAWSVEDGNQYIGTYNADAEGYLFSVKTLGIASDGYLEIGYEIRRNGLESHFAKDHLCQGGDIFHTVMKAADGQPYISGAAYNGEDMLWSQTDIYITDANDADQTISVYLDQASGVPSGTVTMLYTDRDGNAQTCSATAHSAEAGRVRADFTGEWCRIFAVGEAVSFALNAEASEAVSSLLSANAPVSNAAGSNKPQFETDNETLMARFLPSEDFLKVVIPEDTPFFGGSTISLNFPGTKVPVTAYSGLDGTFMILGSGGKETELFKDLDMGGDGWKTNSQAKVDRAVNDSIQLIQSDIKKAPSNLAKDENSVKQPFFGEQKAWWSVFFCVQGRVEKDEETEELNTNGQVSAGFVVGFKNEFPFKFVTMPPVKATIGVSAGVGAMINGLYRAYYEPNSKGFDIHKLDVKFGAVSILIPLATYASLGVGADFLEAGIKGCVSINLALPLIATDYKNNFGASIDARVTFYGQLLLLHVEWLLVRVSWAYENGECGDLNGYVIFKGKFPKNSASAPLKAARINQDSGPSYSPVLGETGVDCRNIDLDTSVVWNYAPASVNGSKTPRTSATLPRKFELENGNEVDMTIWAENNRILVSANGMDVAHELVIPDAPADDLALKAAKLGIESGAYPIIDVNVNSGSSHYDRVGSFLMPVEVAVVAVTYAKSFKTVQQTVGGKTVDVTAPDETETLAMAMILTMGSTTPIILNTDDGRPAAYVLLSTSDSIREFYPYPCQIHLKERPGHPGEPCIDTENSFAVVTGALFEDGTLTAAYYHFPNARVFEDSAWEQYEILRTCITDDVPVFVGVDTVGDIYSGVLTDLNNPEEVTVTSGDQINDFILYDLPDTNGEVAAFYLEKTAQEGLSSLKAIPMQLQGDNPHYAVFTWNTSAAEDRWDFETDIPSTLLHMDHLINLHSLNTTLYWFDTGLKAMEGSEEKQEIARVRGVYFNWFDKKASKPFTVATLYGDDGQIGENLPNLAPLTSFECGGKFYFARVLEKENKEGESDSADWRQGAYMVYSAPISNITRMSVIGAASEYHAMSAGRSGNFTFTLLNDGNSPITSATMRVSRILKNADGTETKETVAEYTLYPQDESQNRAAFWSPCSAVPDVRTGFSAVRQIDTIFDSLTGGPLRSNSRILDSFLPESVFAYNSTIAIPEDWDGLQLLRAEIVRAYGPVTVRSDGNPQLVMYDMERGAIYGVDANGTTSDRPLLTANGVPMRVEKSAPFDLVVDTAEIAMSCKMHEKNGETYISASISQTGNTAMNASKGNITLRAYVDDEKDYPTYVHTFANHTTGDIVLNIDAPVSVLTGGRTADRLTLVAADTAEDNVDLSLLNNYKVFNLNEDLRWIVHPQDQTVQEGGTVVFPAQAEGGVGPYTYQWYRLVGTKWVEIGTGDTLTLTNCAGDLDGSLYRCMVTDALGQMLISSEAKLTVKRLVPPPTGDSSHIRLWIGILLLSAAVLMYVTARRRKLSDQRHR